MRYRPEVDGLRALAVLPVLLFHAGAESFRGGFVGVDIFFVISGYLITTIILSDMRIGRFSLRHFYERRARRILPALFLVMFCSLPVAWHLLLPSDLRDFSQSLLAVSTFTSNVLFWRESGYWEAASELKPMLHTWSLAVEEQYYVLFPLFLMLMWRMRKRLILSTFLATAVLSLTLSVWGATHAPVANFYLLPTRAWELAIGASIAFYFVYRDDVVRKLRSHPVIDEVMGIIGLAMIVYSIHCFDEGTPFPSLYALLPTLGTGFVILFASESTVVGRILAAKPLVGIGLISYSAYLWHQPILAFARHWSPLGLPKPILIGLALTSLPLAYLSWRFVEQPFRRRGVFSGRQVFAFAAAGSVFFASIGFVGHWSNGFDSRTTETGLAYETLQDKLRINQGLGPQCDQEAFGLPDGCSTSDVPEIVIWGDSFAMHLVAGILASEPDAGVVQITKSVCGPFFDVAPVVPPRWTTTWAAECLEFTQNVKSWLSSQSSIKYAVLSSPFVTYLKPDRELLLRNDGLTASNFDLIVKEFEKTLTELKRMGIEPIIVSPTPETGADLGRCLARMEWTGRPLSLCDFTNDEFPQDLRRVFQFLEEFEDRYTVIRLDQLMCQAGRCVTHSKSKFLYRDDHHLSYEGSSLLGQQLDLYSLVTGKKALGTQ